MISGATRGQGGRNLSAHLLKAEHDQTVEIVPPRGILSRGDLHDQLRELVTAAAWGRTDRPCYHVHVDPPPDAVDCQAVLDTWWTEFEKEFGLRECAYVGTQHVKYGRRHEHRVYSLVRPDGRVVDLSWDYLRRTRVSMMVAHAHGLAPTPTPHARALVAELRKRGREGGM